MKTIGFENIKLRGELAYRVIKSYARLEGKCYKPEEIFTSDNHGWPGDWEGRTMLALILLAQTTGREPAYLDQMLELLYKRLNERGYLGRILPDRQFDEQQLSGHNWMLRALTEYYLWKKDENILEMINRMVKNLYLPARGFYRTYPMKPEERVFEGTAAGYLTGDMVRNWFISTDTGCAFMSLDALSQYYEIFRDKAAGELLDEMIEMFMRIDFIQLSMQTHASLSATRGIIRYYEATGNHKYLEFARDFFKLYITQGMTENHANYSWFGRPYSTEPCAVVDSYMLAMALFKNIRVPEYLEIAQKIYYNAFGYGQRPNGGCGCDTCAGAHDVYLRPADKLYEAYWCCTMRGGEGLSRLAENLVLSEDKDIYFTNLNNGVFKTGENTISVRTSYPYVGETRFRVEGSGKGERLKIYLPSVIEKRTVRVTYNGNNTDFSFDNSFVCIPLCGDKCAEIVLTFKIGLIQADRININTIEGYHSFRHGVLVLGAKTEKEINGIDAETIEYHGNGVYRLKGLNTELSPINDMIDLDFEESKKDMRQILFK